MIKAFGYRGAAVLLCVFLAAAPVTGCARYEKINLPELEDTIEETIDEVIETRTEENIEEAKEGIISEDIAADAQTETAPCQIELEDVNGEVAADGAAVAGLSPLESEKTTSRNVAEESQEAVGRRIVAIDAGHQVKGNPEKEPIGPGSSTMKVKVASGAVGISTGIPEYELTLTVAKKVEKILEERGYQVVMIRDSHDVNISNAERARIANESGASVFVRIHANSLDSSSVHGTLSMCQTEKNPYNGELHEESYDLSKKITDAVCDATGFKNRGVQETDTMSGINWCTIPVTIVEMGFMSNPEEDEKMAQEEYQALIAGGIANGIDAYFEDSY